MSKELFRKKAIDKISSPEQLDTLIKVTSPANWLMLLAFAIVIVVAVLWGFYGRIPTKVKGTGIFLSGQSITKLQSDTSGEIISLNVKAGDVVKRGEILARIKQPELEQKIKLLSGRVDTLKDNLLRFDTLNQNSLFEQVDYLKQQEKNLNNEIKDLNEHKSWLERRVSKSKTLRDKGAMTEIEYHKVEKELTDVRLQVHKAESKLQDIVHKRAAGLNSIIKEFIQKENEIEEKESQLKQLKFELNEKSTLISHTSGKILEVSVGKNQWLQQGEDILTLIHNRRTEELEAIVYFPPDVGKKIKYGMNAQVAPLVIKTSKYGYIQGIVKKVNVYPSTVKGMQNTLQNQELIKKLSAGGAPIKVLIELLPSADTVSGFKWTSSKGPSIEIQNGTICTANIIVEEEPPIGFIIPLFRKYILGISDEVINTGSSDTKSTK